MRKNKPSDWNESPVAFHSSSFFYSTVTKDIKQMHNYPETKDFLLVSARKREIASLGSISSSGPAMFLMINCRLY